MHITRQLYFWLNFTEVRYENLSMDINSGPPHHSRVRRDDAEPAALSHTAPGHIDADPLRNYHPDADGRLAANPNA